MQTTRATLYTLYPCSPGIREPIHVLVFIGLLVYWFIGLLVYWFIGPRNVELVLGADRCPIC